MKKYFIILTSILASVSILASCSQQLLEIEQHSVIDQDSYYENATDDDALSLIAGIYRYYYTNLFSGGAPSSGNNPLQQKNCLGGDSYHASDAAVEIQEYSDHALTPNSIALKPFYQHHYAIVKYANLILEKLADDTPVKKLVRAEAQAFRGIIYIDIIRYWGTPALVDHVLTPTEAKEITNGDPAELWKMVEDDLLAAAEVLPSKAGKDGQKAIGGRLTKEACYAYLGRAKLWQKDYAGAANYLGKVISSNLYDLLDDPAKIYRPAADLSCEYIFEHNSNDENTDNKENQEYRWNAAFLGWRASNIRIPADVIDGSWGYLSPAKEFGEFIYTYDRGADGELSKRAKTLVISFDDLMTSGWFFNGLVDESGQKILPQKGSDVVWSAPVNYCGGYFQIRLLTYKEDLFPYTSLYNAYNKRNYPYMRYTEVLLSYAEAVLNTAPTASLSGLEALNKVRVRAGLPALSSYTLSDVKNERRAEMFFENERFFDLVRWGDAATVLANKGKVDYDFYGYVNDGGVGSEWDIRSKEGKKPAGFISGRDELLPFPLSEIESTNIKQNPNY